MDSVVERKKTYNADASSSYSAFANLPDSLLIEILCRLPCKSAHQVKCVSKHWFSIISDSYFIQRFLSTHAQPPPYALWIKGLDKSNGQELWKLLVTSKEPEFQSQEFSLSFLPCFKTGKGNLVNIEASCNDLLLCSAATDSCPTVYYICNPLTKHWVALPPVYHRNLEACAGLICENKSNHYGYRVVCIVGNTLYSAVKIFSSETGRWKETIHTDRVQDFPPWLYNQAIACEGILHWWSPWQRGFVTCDPFNKDGNLKFSSEYYPAELKPEFTACQGVCKGRTCLGQLSSDLQDGDLATLRVWQLEDCGGGKWCLKHEIPLDELKSEEAQLDELLEYEKWITAPMYPLGLLSFHPYNESIIYMSGPHCVVSCNIERKTLEMVSEISSRKICYGCLAYPFELPRWPSSIPSSINLSDSDKTSV